MNKYNIQVIGHRRYLANTLEDAKDMALKDISYIHPNLNMSINGYMDLGPVVKED